MNPKRKLLVCVLAAPALGQDPSGGLRVFVDFNEPVSAGDRAGAALSGDHSQPRSAPSGRNISAQGIPLRSVELVDLTLKTLIDAALIHGLAVNEPCVLSRTPTESAAKRNRRRLVLVVNGSADRLAARIVAAADSSRKIGDVVAVLAELIARDVLRDDRARRVIDKRECAVSHGTRQRRRKRCRRRRRSRGRRRSPVWPAFREARIDSRRTYPQRIGTVFYLRAGLGVRHDTTIRRLPQAPRTGQAHCGKASSLVPRPGAEEIAAKHGHLYKMENRAPGSCPSAVNSALPSA